jgi:hypothetical protein
MTATARVSAGEAGPAVQTRQWQERKEIAIPLLVLLGMALVIPANLGGPLLHDSFAINWVWADQFTAELGRGNLYPRWLPLSNGGLGSPVFYYYPPLAFHLSGMFGLLGLSTYASTMAAFAAAFAGSGIACWYWLLRRADQPLIGACFFMAAPYHLFDFTVRGALAESVGIALIPVIAIGLRRIAERTGGVGLAAASYGALICTHLPLALLVSVFFVAPYALVHRRELVKFALAVAAGIGLSAVYLFPALALEQYRDVDQLYRSRVLRTEFWSIYEANWHDGVYMSVFAIIAVVIGAAGYAAVVRRDPVAMGTIVIALLIAGIIPHFWSLPLLEKVQFPYRGLPIAEFGLATVIARLPGNARIAALAGPLLLSVLILPGFGIGGSDLRQLRASHPDVQEYLPKGVLKRGQTRPSLREIMTPRVPPPEVRNMVVEPVFYFPAWSCGSMEPRTQLLMHKPSCVPRLTQTRPEQLGAAVSFASLVFLLLFGMRRNRRDGRSWTARPGRDPLPS